MAQEARSHLFIKLSEDNGSVPQNATVDILPTESQTGQTDDRDQSEVVNVIRPELRERHYSAGQSPSRADSTYRSRKQLDRPGVNRSPYQPDAVRADKHEAKQVSIEKPSAVVSVQKQSSDNCTSKSNNSKDKRQTQAASVNETSGSPDVSMREKHKKSRTTTDVKQLVTEKLTAGVLENDIKKSSRSRHETKGWSHGSSESRPSDMRLDDHKVKSVVCKPPDKTKTGVAGRNSSCIGNSSQKSLGLKSDDEITRVILSSFDEVCQVSRTFLILCLFCVQIMAYRKCSILQR